MTTLTADTPRDYGLGEFNDHPVIAADIIYEGAAVGDNGAGYARPLAGGDKFLGFATQQADNSTGAAGAINVRVRKVGTVQLSVSGAVITDIGQPVYATDDNVFVFLPTGATYIGKVTRFVSSGVVVVDFDAELGADPWADRVRETVTTAKTLDAQDASKAFFVTATAVVTLPAVSGVGDVVIANNGPYGTVQITVVPNFADMIEGPDIAAVDTRGLTNTLATAQRGDYIRLAQGDANGWVVTAMEGTWATGPSSSISPSPSASPSPSVSASPSASPSPS